MKSYAGKPLNNKILTDAGFARRITTDLIKLLGDTGVEQDQERRHRIFPETGEQQKFVRE